MTVQSSDVVIVGAGITGIATAYYLSTTQGITDILLVDVGQPMAFTSAQSGENYRNWWPHPTMVRFTNRSIDLLEEIALTCDNRIKMNRRGYALSTRETNIDDVLEQLQYGLGNAAGDLLRFHKRPEPGSYQPPLKADWQTAPDGVDVLQNPALIRRTFPGYAQDVESVIHIRRGGDISSQQLGMYMLERIRANGGKIITGSVEGITRAEHIRIEVAQRSGIAILHTENLINAAGPFANRIAEMIDIGLPVYNTFQQKIAFEDSAKAIPRNMPFSIDLDDQLIDWSDEEREVLLADEEFSWLAASMPGAIHCRPDGGDNGAWVKLGWAYNQKRETATRELPLDAQFPEIVLRGAARLNPSLKTYYEKLPRGMYHYGGWYTMTEENWPLIGPMQAEGVFMNCAGSGFGTMTACAAGELCAAWVGRSELPDYAGVLSSQRYADSALMQQLYESNKGVL